MKRKAGMCPGREEHDQATLRCPARRVDSPQLTSGCWLSVQLWLLPYDLLGADYPPLYWCMSHQTRPRPLTTVNREHRLVKRCDISVVKLLVTLLLANICLALFVLITPMTDTETVAAVANRASLTQHGQ
jgi:hypothetical protein